MKYQYKWKLNPLRVLNELVLFKARKESGLHLQFACLFAVAGHEMSLKFCCQMSLLFLCALQCRFYFIGTRTTSVRLLQQSLWLSLSSVWLFWYTVWPIFTDKIFARPNPTPTPLKYMTLRQAVAGTLRRHLHWFFVFASFHS